MGIRHTAHIPQPCWLSSLFALAIFFFAFVAPHSFANLPVVGELSEDVITRVAGPRYEHWSEERSRILEEVFELRRLVETYAAEEELRIGHRGEFYRLINKNQINKENEQGKAELTIIDGTPITRVVHDESELAFLCLDINITSPVSKHLKKVVARQHLIAGASRGHKKAGRDTVLIWMDGDKIIDTIYLAQPHLLSAQYWKEYKRHVWHAPTLDHLALGTFCAIAQTGLGTCVMMVRAELDPSAEFSTGPLIMSGGFGLVMGTFVKTQSAWQSIGTPVAKIAKAGLVSATFAYGTLILMDGLSPVELVTGAFGAYAATHFHIFKNITLKNWAKIGSYELAWTRERNRLNTKPIKIFLPTKGWVETKVSWADGEFQLVYLIPFTTSLADLVSTKIPVHEMAPFMEMLFPEGIPAGLAALVGSGFVMRYVVMKYAEHYGLDGAKKLRSAWARMWKNIFLGPHINVAAHISSSIGVQTDGVAPSAKYLGMKLVDRSFWKNWLRAASLAPVGVANEVGLNLGVNLEAPFAALENSKSKLFCQRALESFGLWPNGKPR